MSLSTLVLNGMDSSPSCAPSIFFSASNTLPSCIFSITTLEKLYLAGNALVGDLMDFQLPQISELNLDSNRIRGSLPSFFKNKTISVFGVGNNRIEGVLDLGIHPAAFAETSYIKTHINRISGRLQVRSLEQYEQLEVLDGNLIDCSTLPTKDPNYSAYQCGTKNLDVAIMTFFSFFGIVMLCVLLARIYPDTYRRFFYSERFSSIERIASSRHALVQKEAKVTCVVMHAVNSMKMKTCNFCVHMLILTVVVYSGNCLNLPIPIVRIL